MKNKRDIQRKLLTDRPKTVGSRLYLRGLEENYKNHKTTSEQLIPIQQKQAGRNNGKEKISIDINSKVFKLAHGLVKTPNIRRFHGNDDSNTSEESATEDNDDNSTNTDEELSNSQRYKPNVQNSGGFLAPEGMNLEARRASRGNEDMAGIFRLAIERQRRLSVVTGDEYAEWALQMGITNYNGEYSDGEADENEITEDKGYETTSDLINDGKIPERSTSDTNWNYDGGKQDSKLKVQNLPTSGIHSKLNEKKRLSNETTEKISLTERTTRIREPKKGRELKKSPRNALNTKVKDELNKKKEREKVRENKSVISDTKHESGESQSQESANIHEQSDQTNDEIPTETNQRKIGTGLTTGLSEKQLSTQDICQNVTDSNLKELRKINEEPNLFSSDDDDDTDESEEKETDDKDNVKEAAEKEMKMKKELELVQRRLQVSSFESKKFKLKIYVKPQLRYKTERMYLLRRKNLLHRQIALASQDMAGADAILPGSEGRFTLQVSCFLVPLLDMLLYHVRTSFSLIQLLPMMFINYHWNVRSFHTMAMIGHEQWSNNDW